MDTPDYKDHQTEHGPCVCGRSCGCKCGCPVCGYLTEAEQDAAAAKGALVETGERLSLEQLRFKLKN